MTSITENTNGEVRYYDVETALLGTVRVYYYTSNVSGVPNNLPNTENITVLDVNADPAHSYNRYIVGTAVPSSRCIIKPPIVEDTNTELSVYLGATDTLLIINNQFGPLYRSYGVAIEFNAPAMSINNDDFLIVHSGSVVSTDHYAFIPSQGSQYIEQINTLTAANTTLTDQNTSLQTQLTNVNNQLIAANTQLSSNTATINDLNNEIINLNATITDLNNMKQDLLNTIADKDTDITNLTNQILTINSQLAAAQTTITNLNNTIANKDITISNLNTQITTLNVSLNGSDDTINTLSNQIVVLNTTISDLNTQINTLKAQISSGTSSNVDLLNQLNLAREELSDLELQYITRLQEVEDKLSNTTGLATLTAESLAEIKASLMNEIMEDIRNPRFGYIPLVLAKQAEAAIKELITDPNTGHIYIKNTTGLVSKTKDNENKLNDINSYINSTWVSVSVDSDNYSMFKDDVDNSIYANSDKTYSSNINLLSFNKIKIKYNPLCRYLVAVKFTHGKPNSVVFVDDNHVQYPTVLVNITADTALFQLTGVVPNVNIYPSVVLDNNTAIKNILVYRDVDTSNVRKVNLTTLDLSSDPSLITGLFNATTYNYKVNSANGLRIHIPSNTLRDGLYSLTMKTLNNIASGIVTLKCVANGTVIYTEAIDFSKIPTIAGSKIYYTLLQLPKITTEDTYVDITTANVADIDIEYIIMDMVSFNINNYYTKSYIDNMNTNITNSQTNFTNVINQINSRPIVWNGPTAPVDARVGDWWGDDTYNVVRRKINNTTWQTLGAKYN
jgi:hypothetical protein